MPQCHEQFCCVSDAAFIERDHLNCQEYPAAGCWLKTRRSAPLDELQQMQGGPRAMTIKATAASVRGFVFSAAVAISFWLLPSPQGG